MKKYIGGIIAMEDHCSGFYDKVKGVAIYGDTKVVSYGSLTGREIVISGHDATDFLPLDEIEVDFNLTEDEIKINDFTLVKEEGGIFLSFKGKKYEPYQVRTGYNFFVRSKEKWTPGIKEKMREKEEARKHARAKYLARDIGEDFAKIVGGADIPYNYEYCCPSKATEIKETKILEKILVYNGDFIVPKGLNSMVFEGRILYQDDYSSLLEIVGLKQIKRFVSEEEISILNLPEDQYESTRKIYDVEQKILGLKMEGETAYKVLEVLNLVGELDEHHSRFERIKEIFNIIKSLQVFKDVLLYQPITTSASLEDRVKEMLELREVAIDNKTFFLVALGDKEADFEDRLSEKKNTKKGGLVR